MFIKCERKNISKDSFLITHLDSLFLFKVSKNSVEKLFLACDWISYSEPCILFCDASASFLSCGLPDTSSCISDTLFSISAFLEISLSTFFEISLSSKFNLKG